MKIFLTAVAIGIALAQAPGAAAQDQAYGLESRAAIGAHHICSGLWVVGRVTKRSAEEIIAQDIAPFRDFGWDKNFSYVVDDAKRTVTVRGSGIPTRMAKFSGGQGCAILPRGESDIHFKPVAVTRNLPDAATQPWPLGDANAVADQPNAGVEAAQERVLATRGFPRRSPHRRTAVPHRAWPG